MLLLSHFNDVCFVDTRMLLLCFVLARMFYYVLIGISFLRFLAFTKFENKNKYRTCIFPVVWFCCLLSHIISIKLRVRVLKTSWKYPEILLLSFSKQTIGLLEIKITSHMYFGITFYHAKPNRFKL